MPRSILIFCVVLLALLSGNLWAQIRINEYQTTNRNTITDEDGDTPDWIELYNASNSTVNLSGWFLSDNPERPQKWQLPEVQLASGAYLLIYASGKDRLELPNLHTSFRLSSGRDGVYLYDTNVQLIDEHFPQCIPSDKSYGYREDGSLTKSHFMRPSPGSSNMNGNPFTPLTGNDTVIFSTQGGFYQEGFGLTLQSNQTNTTIYYTIDGQPPNDNDLVYTGEPLQIINRSPEKDEYADILTSPTWQEPDGRVFKATVVRAVPYIGGCPAGEVVSHTFFVHPQMRQRYAFPVVSLSVDEDDFFSEDAGIYVPGNVPGGNYNQSGGAWEREAHLEYFNPEGQILLKRSIGVRIHGRGSRNNPQKTLRLYADAEYGQEGFDFSFFAEKAEMDNPRRVLLRATQSDFSLNPSLFKDELCQLLVRELNLDYQAQQPVIVFLNGEYWGIHHLRERIDEFFIRDNYPSISIENLNLLQLQGEIIQGDNVTYLELMNYVRENSLSIPENYDYVISQIDLDNYIDYLVAQLYLANVDWPNNNLRYWRPRQTAGKWRWIFFDCDGCFNRLVNNQLINYFDPDYQSDWSTDLQIALFENEDFRRLFLNRFLYHLNTTFEPSQVVGKIDSLARLYAPYVPEHSQRWQRPSSYSAWEASVENLRQFALYRPLEVMEQIQNLLGSPFEVFPNPSSDVLNVKLIESDNALAFDWELYDYQGKQVEIPSEAQSSSHHILNLRQLPRGFYILRLRYGGFYFMEKIIKQD